MIQKKATVLNERPTLIKLEAKPDGFPIKSPKGFLLIPQNSVFENKDSSHLASDKRLKDG